MFLSIFVILQIPFSSTNSPNDMNLYACDYYGQQITALYREKYPFDESDPNYKDILKKEQELREKMDKNCGSVHP